MEQVKLPPLREQAAQALRNGICSGQLTDGQELTQEQAAAMLGISRIPVREAFLVLENEGLLHRLPNRHVRVVGITADRLRQNFAVLSALESELAVLSLQTGLHLPEAHEDDALHHSFAVSLDNPALHQLYTTQRRGLYQTTAALLPRTTLQEDLNKAILSAAVSRDPTALRKSIRNYYDTMAIFAIKELKL